MSYLRKIITEEYDNETGEITKTPKYQNSETGEEEYVNISPPPQKPKTFKIPSAGQSYQRSSHKKFPTPRKTIETATLGKPLLYLLPTTILFYPIIALIIVFIEVPLHIWAHKKNKILISKNLPHRYQSPLHIICREFCAKCRDEASAMKISKFQERRQDKFVHRYGLKICKASSNIIIL